MIKDKQHGKSQKNKGPLVLSIGKNTSMISKIRNAITAITKIITRSETIRKIGLI
jgi:hypothetical protein